MNSYSSSMRGCKNPCLVISDYYDGYANVSQKKKEKNMREFDPKEYPFHVGYNDFKTRADADNFAKKQSGEIGDDVIISQRIAIVKFPVPDLKVEELVVS